MPAIPYPLRTYFAWVKTTKTFAEMDAKKRYRRNGIFSKAVLCHQVLAHE
jgi:hypothetical protein